MSHVAARPIAMPPKSGAIRDPRPEIERSLVSGLFRSPDFVVKNWLVHADVTASRSGYAEDRTFSFFSDVTVAQGTTVSSSGATLHRVEPTAAPDWVKLAMSAIPRARAMTPAERQAYREITRKFFRKL